MIFGWRWKLEYVYVQELSVFGWRALVEFADGLRVVREG